MHSLTANLRVSMEMHLKRICMLDHSARTPALLAIQPCCLHAAAGNLRNSTPATTQSLCLYYRATTLGRRETKPCQTQKFIAKSISRFQSLASFQIGMLTSNLAFVELGRDVEWISVPFILCYLHMIQWKKRNNWKIPLSKWKRNILRMLKVFPHHQQLFPGLFPT